MESWERGSARKVLLLPTAEVWFTPQVSSNNTQLCRSELKPSDSLQKYETRVMEKVNQRTLDAVRQLAQRRAIETLTPKQELELFCSLNMLLLCLPTPQRKSCEPCACSLQNKQNAVNYIYYFTSEKCRASVKSAAAAYFSSVPNSIPKKARTLDVSSQLSKPTLALRHNHGTHMNPVQYLLA